MKFLVGFASVLISVLAASSAHAATYTVSRADDPAPDGCVSEVDCSLREAVIAANANAGTDDILLLSGTTYEMSIANSSGDEDAAAEGDLDITESVNIYGSDTTTIDMNSIDRGFDVTSTAATLQLAGGTLTGGVVTNGGGGVSSVGELILNQFTITGCSSGIFGGGVMVTDANLSILNGSVISNNTLTGASAGGGVYYENHDVGEGITMTESTVSGNSTTHASGNAGGLYIDGGNHFITRSTIEGNSTLGNGSAILVDDELAGTDETLFIKNSTISGNPGNSMALIDVSPTGEGLNVDVAFSTLVTENSAAYIFQTDSGLTPVVTVRNSILDGGTDHCESGITYDSNGYNIDTSNGCGFASTGDTTTDPALAALADNGGTTETMAIDENSAAFNAIPAASCIDNQDNAVTEDQREVARPQLTNCDIGAFEFQDTTAPAITLNGSDPVSHECGTTYTDAGATADDNVDGSVSVDTNNGVDEDTPGSYAVTYDAADDSGNNATQETRTVNVVDTTDPVVTVLGANPALVYLGQSYADASATASDSCDPSFTAAGTITTDNPVNTSVVGTYTVTYTATDDSGNTDTATRTVQVVSRGTVTEVTPLENNRVRVEYSGGSSQVFTVFDSGTAKPKVRLSKGGEEIIVVKKNGRRIRVFDAFLGDLLDGMRLRKKSQLTVRLKVFNYYGDAREEIIVATRARNTDRLRTTGITLTSGSELRNKNSIAELDRKLKFDIGIQKEKKQVWIMNTETDKPFVKYRVSETAQLSEVK
jgi:hypothetical protein